MVIVVYGVQFIGFEFVKWVMEYIIKGGFGIFIGGYVKGVSEFYGVSEIFGKIFVIFWVLVFILIFFDIVIRFGRFVW